MAIQISGTTVINDSRQLQNVASLDATTTASIKSAVGGGGSVTATASGSIANGDTVVLNSNGTVSAVTGSEVAGSVGSESSNFNSANTEIHDALLILVLIKCLFYLKKRFLLII